jgi:hypothetical protein
MAKMNVMEKVKTEFPEFAEETASLSTEDINARLAQFAKDWEAIEDSLAADQELEAAKENVASLAGPYRDAKKTLKLKSRYLVSMLKERGQS